MSTLEATLTKDEFITGRWNKTIDVRDFVLKNLTPYNGNADFLEGPSERTKRLFEICAEATKEELANGGVRSIDASTISRINSHKAGYISRENELIVGLQTDELLRRAIKPYGGVGIVEKACEEQGVELDPRVKDIFDNYV